MYKDIDIIKNISTIYDSNTSLRVLKDFERVIDELNVYVFKNWEDGEVVEGPIISRHWVKCSFMWPEDKMPDPMGGKRLLDYDCKISYKKSVLVKPRKIKDPEDIRPASKKGIMDQHPIWIVEIQIPKQLMFNIFKGSIRGSQEKDMDIESLYQDDTVTPDMGSIAPAPTAPAEEVANAPTI
jgi:hypothetical protein